MNFNVVLDISAIIWDKNHYESNENYYYELAYGISNLFEILINEKPNIILRNELIDEMINGFPCSLLPNRFYDFKRIVYSFLGDIGSNIITYSNQIIPNIIAIPNLIKGHYTDTTKKEIYYLISEIHRDSQNESVYFTFRYLWNSIDNLKTKVDGFDKEYETIISDNENDINAFFNRFKPIFKHHSKHNKKQYNTKEKWEELKDKGRFESRLSCYNGKDGSIPQQLLNSAIKYKSVFYNKDYKNNVYVIFRKTRKNIYHGYDENNPDNIPEEVRNKLDNKNGKL